MAESAKKQRTRSRSQRRDSPSAPNFEELFHLLIDNVRDYAIFILNRDGRTLTWNAGVKRMLGYDEPAFIGLHFEELFRVDERPAAQSEMTKAANDGRSDDERWHLRKDGTELWVTGVLTALRDPEGNLRGYAKIMRDTTAQRNASLEREELLRRELAAMEEAERADRMKDEFLAVVSHELRTPLNAILGWAHLLAGSQLDEAQAVRATETIKRNAKAQAKLVADLLDVSRLVTGKLQLDVRPVSVQQVLKAALDAVYHPAAAKNVTMSLVVIGKPPAVAADIERLQQVILNLLSNAIRFTPSGGTIDVHLERQQDDVELIVRDSGEGIPQVDLPHIFDRFYQASSGRRPAGGLGLGLTIARRVVEAHHGSIEARSEGAGKGATFVVRLPQAPDILTAVDLDAMQRAFRLSSVRRK